MFGERYVRVMFRAVYADGHRGEWRTWESLLYMINCGLRLWKRRVPGMDVVKVEGR